MKMKKGQVRQGDVCIEKITSIPANVKTKRLAGPPILAHGEVTGHCHEIKDSEAKVFESENGLDGENRGISVKFAKVKASTRVVHQEHAPIALDPGEYRISQQREYTPAAIVRVAD